MGREVGTVKAPPGFAISVPIGGYHPLLRDCLKSLAIQTPLPQVAFLDASNDPRVAAILDEFSDLAAYRRSGPDGGQSDAIIEGWRNLGGEILGWLNADDALYPGALAQAFDHYNRNPETDVFYGHSTIIDDDDNIKGYHWAVEPPSDRILAGGIISQPSCFFRRRKLDEIGGLNRDLHYTMDWDLWVRFWRAGGRFQFTDAVMSRVLWSREAKTGGFNKERRRELERIISANGGFVRRTKSRAGFALHHILEYLTPKAASEAVRARSARSGAAIHGLDRAGGVIDTATIPLVHYDDQAKSQLALELKGGGVNLKICAAAAEIEVRREGSHILQLDEPLQSGQVLNVQIENAAKDRAFLTSLRWV